jgi:N-acylneuraminate cytidylyltransferase
MIAWSIGAARESGCFDVIAVSTDSTEVAEVAKCYGAEAPFVRPAELADDQTGTAPVMRHAVDWYIGNYGRPAAVCCIYATAPFLDPADIKLGYEMLLSTESSYVFAAASFSSPIQRAFRLSSRGRVEMFYPELFNTRSQDLEIAYHDAGQFYWGRVPAWLAEEKVFAGGASVVVVPRYRVQDIDTEEDWKAAERLYGALVREGRVD